MIYLIILIAGFFILLALGTPIAFALSIPSALVMMMSPDLSPIMLAQRIHSACDSFSMMAMPFFMLAGSLMGTTGVTKNIVDFANSIVGHIRGGLAHTSSLAGMIMAGVSGSANADASALGALLVPSMKEAGYEEGFSVSLVASCGLLGVIIPPSVVMVVYSGVSGVSIVKLFMAGIIPGILCGVLYMVFSYFYSLKRGMPKGKFGGFRNIWNTFKKSVWALLMPVIIIGSIVSGICTATEAGVIAVMYGILYGILSRNLSMSSFIKCVKDAAFASAMSMCMIAFAVIFGYVLTVLNFPNIITDFMMSHISSPYGFALFVVAFLFVMGMFVDSTATMLMMIPIFLPIATAYGFDPLHFSMFAIIGLVSAGLTPPVGITLFVVCNTVKTNINVASRSVWPFVFINYLVMILVICIPQIATFIPTYFAA